MPFLLLLFLMFICLPDGDYPEPLAPMGSAQSPMELRSRSVALTGLAMAVVALGAAAAAQWTRRQLHRHPAQRDAILRRYAGWRMYHLLGLCLVYGLAVFGLGWGWAVKQQVGLAPGAELLVLAPFLLTLIVSWACFYDAERAIHETGPAVDPGHPFWGRGAYVVFHVRHNLGLLFVPIFLLIVERAFERQFPSLQEEKWHWPMTAVGVLVMACLFISLPWILRLVLGLRPLPEGPLRDRLLATAWRLNFRCSDILLWNTRGGVANAMVVGVVPYIRYVLLTDRLVSDLSPDEVEAVFGHEIGHVKHHHMLYYLGFLLVSMGVVIVVWEQLAQWLNLEAPQYLEGLPFVALLGTYIFVVFGFLSRRCERQADIYGCRAVSCQRGDCPGHDDAMAPAVGGVGLCPTGIRTFIEALEKVARLNGISRDRPGWLQSWQHSTIARRVEFLQRMLADPAVEPRFQHTVRLVKWVLLLGLAAVLMAFLASEVWAVLREAF
jgi:Zn-dependent protease with chaperone function